MIKRARQRPLWLRLVETAYPGGVPPNVFDRLGSAVATTDVSGDVVERYEYTAYGQEIDSTSGDGNPWRYVSGYFDTATGMLKLGARYYMPTLHDGPSASLHSVNLRTP